MTTQIDRGSAKIYQFPARGRFAASANTPGNMKEIAAVNARGINTVNDFGGWYHEEAIRDAERNRKH